MAPFVLYVDDEPDNLEMFRRCFDDQFSVLVCGSAREGLDLLARHDVGVLVADQRMPEMTGIELLREAAARYPTVSRMLLTAYSDRELLVSAIQEGRVHDYQLKPWTEEELGLRLRTALEAHQRRAELARAAVERDLLRESAFGKGPPTGLVGLTGGLRHLDALLTRVAASGATVLLRGETGTGKELVAREIHRRSDRAQGPFISVNCAALADSLLESELFGHESGAFTGAQKSRPGRFELAHGGTLLLDEIGDVSANLQLKLLRVLQERELERVGGTRTIHVDIRIIAATHRNLEELVQRGDFRPDLFFRLNVVPLTLPPLRERAEDIEPLAGAFLTQFGRELGKTLSLSDEALTLLRRYDWPGNVRELRNVIERAVVLAEVDGVLGPEDLALDFSAVQTVAARSGSVFEEIDEEESRRIRDALKQARGSRAAAARILGIPRTTLNHRMRRLGIR